MASIASTVAGPGRSPRPADPSALLEHIQRQRRGDQRVGGVDDLGDPQLRGAAHQDVGGLAAEAAL